MDDVGLEVVEDATDFDLLLKTDFNSAFVEEFVWTEAREEVSRSWFEGIVGVWFDGLI